MIIPAAQLYVSDDLLSAAPAWAETADGFRRLAARDAISADASTPFRWRRNYVTPDGA